MVYHICWWTSPLPVHRERYEIEMEREQRLKQGIREVGRE